MFPLDDRSSTNGSGSSNALNDPQVVSFSDDDDDDSSLPENVQDNVRQLVSEAKSKGSLKRGSVDPDKAARAPTQVRSRITVVCAEVSGDWIFSFGRG